MLICSQELISNKFSKERWHHRGTLAVPFAELDQYLEESTACFYSTTGRWRLWKSSKQRSRRPQLLTIECLWGCTCRPTIAGTLPDRRWYKPGTFDDRWAWTAPYPYWSWKWSICHSSSIKEFKSLPTCPETMWRLRAPSHYNRASI